MITFILPSELAYGDIEGWNTDSDVEGYLANRSAAKEYRDAGGAGDFDVCKTLAKTNSARKYLGGNERAIQPFRGIYQNSEINSRAPGAIIPKERASEFSAKRKSEISETAFVRLAGDYGRRRT